MARRASPEPPKVKPARLFDLTKIAVDTWLVDSGKVAKPGEIKLNRTLKSYGLKTPHVNDLSEHVIDVVKTKTGIKFDLTANELQKFSQGTLHSYIKGSVVKFIAALPGEPTTLPGKPRTLPDKPKAAPKPKADSALPGEPTTLPSRPSSKR